MDQQLKVLYERVKAQEIGVDAAVAELKALRQGREGGAESAAPVAAPALVEERAVAFFHKSLAASLKMSPQRVSVDAALEEYGIDSVMVLQLTGELEQQFGVLPKTLFYEYQTIRSLAAYFVASHRNKVVELLGMDVPAPASEKALAPRGRHAVPKAARTTAARQGGAGAASGADVVESACDIAVIGLAGRYPQADNMQAYWRNLRDGRDCITEIPATRWDHSKYFDPEKGAPGKTYSKWGGFIDGVDQFDPLFFGISPREAEIMDPQERLFLQCAYEAIEDAGYTRQALAREQGVGHANVGVFAGVMYEEYQLYGAQETAQGRPMILPGNPANIANRVSYFGNFHGPSMAVDTMCSSSLTTLHLACQSLRRGECSVAIAGGVNVSIHPNKYLMLGMGRFTSSKGQCESFGEGGDGYVPGEGVGAVLLKPLHQAVADGDHIYGVIKASAINHGGKTNGYTVPNPNAQAQVIAQALKESGVPARAVSYIEAHGTGTALGDPIEIAGLNAAFSAQTAERQYCAIGSAKSNIGHCESAAGIAGLTKVLLQMRHQQIVPSLHSATLNPHIDFAATPFVVQQTLAPWERPVLEQDGERREYPRIAGISSFGAGGANAHVVIEEYVAPTRVQAETGPALVVLSARTETALRGRARQLLEALEDEACADLHDLAYTLQVGREAMDERLALQVRDLGELCERLAAYLAGETAVDGLYLGQVKRNKEMLSVFEADEDMGHTLEAWLAKGKFGKVLDLWVNGLAFDWNALYGDVKPKRVSLPTYPFAKERYWLPPMDKGPLSGVAVSPSVLHPLLHANTSTFDEQRYTTVLTGHEYFLADHLVQGRRVLPGVAQLEMAREAMRRAFDAAALVGGIELHDVAFVRPVVVDIEAPLMLHIGLQVEADGVASFDIYSDMDGEEIIHSQGRARIVENAQPPHLGLAALQAQCVRSYSASDCYAGFTAMGLDYGPAMRALQELGNGEDEQGRMLALARLVLPAQAEQDAERFVLNPSLLDASLQASIGLAMEEEGSGKAALPFAIERVVAHRALPRQVYAVLGMNPGSGAQVRKLDVTLCDEQGAVCVELIGFSSRVVETAPAVGTLLFAPAWIDAPALEHAGAGQPDTAGLNQHWVLLCGAHGDDADIEAQLPEARCVRLGAVGAPLAQRYTESATQLLELLRQVMVDPAQGRVLLQLVAGADGEDLLLRGLGGMLRSAALENGRLVVQIVQMAQADHAMLASRLLEQRGMGAQETRYLDGRRQVLALDEAAATEREMPWKDGGVYLIAGGTGGLGLMFAQEIVRAVKAPTLILSARSALNDAQRVQLDALRASGARVEHKRVDLGDAGQVRALIAAIRSECGALHGIVHSAGVLRDGLALKKTAADLAQVLAPKVAGLVHLDEASRDCELDCFILFSSTGAVLGNAGQTDYAAANGFMDGYASYRTGLAAAGQRHGRTLSVNWPLWADGGMGVDAATAKMLWQGMGMSAMRRDSGIAALYRAWASRHVQVLVVEGDALRLRRALRPAPAVPQVVQVAQPAQAGVEQVGDGLRTATQAYLTQLLSAGLKLPGHQIEAQVALEMYGIDSVMIMALTNELEQVFGTLSKTLFFEYQSIEALTGYFLRSHGAPLVALLGTGERPKLAAAPAFAPPPPIAPKRRQRQRFAVSQAPDANRPLDVAIIGLSGRYPQANTLEQYWHNLTQGVNCITEVPAERWNHAEYFDLDKGNPGKVYSKWGGFIDGVDQFDPLFFHITPREAVGMDPQERLFLQCVHATLEDAGYTRDSLRRHQEPGLAGSVGVFVGVMYEEYQLYGAQAQVHGDGYALLGSAASVANRISYYFNFHGPSMALDTMCSSSLTAIHLACQSLARGGCELAVAGGVNVSVHPNKYLMLSQGRFASSDGLCRSFGEGGDGYVPGEGVGAVLLKPLHQAVADGDHIYGVIKASAINHGGKTNGYTVPNPNAQAQVIAQALKESGVPARAVSYIEAHGTGTALGDPIEIAGLNAAFSAQTAERQYCAIGSAKSNIGHCESAAGIAGLTKVLLQMRHGQLVPSLHSTTLNPHIDFAATPFVVQQSLSSWERPMVEEDGQRREYPRIAGLSSFGAGGANAHLIVQEYVAPAVARPAAAAVALVLSARDEERLREQARQLLRAIDDQDLQDDRLADVAYTLQVGREAMECRLACVAASVEEVKSRLSAYVRGDANVAGLVRGEAKRNREALALFTADQELEEAIEKWVQRGKLEKLADLWVKGLAFDWHKLYGDIKPRRMSLPTYPFAKERYWLPAQTPVARTGGAAVLHPLLHANTSKLSEQRYTTVLTGQEYFLADHVVGGQRVLPGVAQLEMAREALEQALDEPADAGQVELRDIVFVRPVVVADRLALHIALQAEDDGSVSFELYSEQGEECVVHTQGRARASQDAAPANIDLASVRSQCAPALSRDDCYQRFGAMGLVYGPAM
ncbi:MAG: SDR family NAD(P)-dependent oxidoreductase, partial [Pseudomonadota bacterium]